MSSTSTPYNPPYTHEEQVAMIKYIIKEKAYERLRSDSFWIEMEKAKITKRTWQSLKQHFRRRLSCQLYFPRFQLKEEEIKKIMESYHNRIEKRNTSRKNARKPTKGNLSLSSDSDNEVSGSSRPTSPIVEIIDETQSETEAREGEKIIIIPDITDDVIADSD